MKKTRNLLTVIALASVASSQAGTPKVYTFNESEEVKQYVTPTGKSTLLKVENDGNEGALTFQSEGGGDHVAFTPDGDLQTSGDGLELEFRTEGALTFGIFTRGSGLEELAYWVHCSLSMNSTV